MLNISCKEHDGIMVLSVYGRVDHASSLDFEKSILKEIEEGHKYIIIDCANFNYISSSGLRVLLLALKVLKTKQGSLVLSAIPPHIYEIIETSGFHTIFSVSSDLDEALEMVRNTQVKTG